MNQTIWQAQVDPPSLGEHEIHIWRQRTNIPKGPRATDCLVREEAERAARFLVEEPRRVYVAVRSTLRSLLGTYLELEPLEIPIAYTAHGKPYLASLGARSDIEFNVSHSGEWAVIAIARGRRVGIDIEDANRTIDVLALAERFFAPNERNAIRMLPTTEERATAFFRVWTQKEAYIKGRSEGLSLDLHRFETRVDPHRPPALLRSTQFPEDPNSWMLFPCDPAPGYTGMLAVERSAGDTRATLGIRLRFFELATPAQRQ